MNLHPNRVNLANRVSALPPAPSGPVLPTTGLVAEYRFDDGTGQVLTDYSGAGNHGQLGATSGAEATDPTWATSPACLDFDGGDYVIPAAAVSAAFAPPNDFCFSFVAHADVLTATRYLIGLINGTLIAVGGISSPSGGLLMQLRSSDSTLESLTAAAVTQDVWFHIAFVMRSGFAELWYNGAKVDQGETDFSSKTFGFVNAAYIGCRRSAGTPGNFWDGGITHAVAYNVAPDMAAVYAYQQALMATRGITLP